MFIHKDIKEALPNVNYNITMFLKLSWMHIIQNAVYPRLKSEATFYLNSNAKKTSPMVSEFDHNQNRQSNISVSAKHLISRYKNLI